MEIQGWTEASEYSQYGLILDVVLKILNWWYDRLWRIKDRDLPHEWVKAIIKRKQYFHFSQCCIFISLEKARKSVLSDNFRGYRNGTLTWNKLIFPLMIKLHEVHISALVHFSYLIWLNEFTSNLRNGRMQSIKSACKLKYVTQVTLKHF